MQALYFIRCRKEIRLIVFYEPAGADLREETAGRYFIIADAVFNAEFVVKTSAVYARIAVKGKLFL